MIDIAKVCFDKDCLGEMEKPNPIHSYDFNKDGWVPFYCTECGLCSDSNYIAAAHAYSAALGHRFIKDVLQIICKNMLKKDYAFKTELFKLLKNRVFFNVYDLAGEIALHCHSRGYSITRDYILKIIYCKLDYHAFV